jgi:proteasome lid subunit RPN8/RPN11/uncharacterized protein (UPF0248 family)
MIDLPQGIKTQALEHAKAEFPAEICGLVAVVKGRRRYFPCKNIAKTNCEHFILDPLDYAAAEDKGEIVAVIHSHPKTSCNPSQADRVACEKSELPWYIVNPQTENWGHCIPEGFELPYVGREFVFGVTDCYTLCRDWYRREMNLNLKDYERRDEWWVDGEDLYLENFANEGFREIPLRSLERGDALLLKFDANIPTHAAVYLGDQVILHHMQGRLSSRDVLGSYYLERTVKALRHESCQGVRGA